MMMRRKLALGSVFPVCSSTSSIFIDKTLYQPNALWCLGEGGIPAYVFAPEFVPSRHPAMAVFLGRSAPSPMLG